MRTATRVALAVSAGVVILAAGAASVIAQDELLEGKVRAGDTVTIPADETAAPEAVTTA